MNSAVSQTRQSAADILERIADNVEKAVIGKRETIELVLIALMSKGHILIEDVPGVGKTSLVSAFARSVDCSFNRIQFTPDVLPSDVVGFSVYNRRTGEFEYKPGAVFCQFLLADEINRTSSKTQSALLEIMEEKQVTVDSVTYPLPSPFTVFATQNPAEYIGTFPLPEAQLDRFFMRVHMGYPSHEEELSIIGLHGEGSPVSSLSAVASPEDILMIQNLTQDIYISKPAGHYIVSLVEQTRSHSQILLGASPRATISLAKAAKACAFLSGRDFVIPDDVQKMAPHVLEHRLVLKQEAKFRNVSVHDIMQNIVKKVNIQV
ncbi:MAG TPA: magnesium chelatase [Ruminococcaceae bacterium]|nr:magnesium chelatase [Oscillospiraceae bacterium]